MKKFGLLVVVVMGAAVCTAIADDDHSHEERCCAEKEVFDRNIRLDFKSTPLEEGDAGIFIMTATPEFRTQIRMEGNDGEIVFEVFGEIELLDDGNFFVRFEAFTRVGHEGGEAEFNVETGVVLTAGKELGVSRLGDKVLTITASYVDVAE